MGLTLQKSTAKKIYPDSPDWFKKVLEENFGKELFKKRSIEDIKTFEDACDELSIDPETVTQENDTPDEAAYKKFKIIAAAINQGWTPDWNNSNQYKWTPWFKLSSGFGFSGSGYGRSSAGAGAGSRLCTDSSEKARYIAEQFKAEYQDYFLYSE